MKQMKCNNGIVYTLSPFGGYYDGHPCSECDGKGCENIEKLKLEKEFKSAELREKMIEGFKGCNPNIVSGRW